MGSEELRRPLKFIVLGFSLAWIATQQTRRNVHEAFKPLYWFAKQIQASRLPSPIDQCMWHADVWSISWDKIFDGCRENFSTLQNNSGFNHFSNYVWFNVKFFFFIMWCFLSPFRHGPFFWRTLNGLQFLATVKLVPLNSHPVILMWSEKR